jgi:hypothetical protein
VLFEYNRLRRESRRDITWVIDGCEIRDRRQVGARRGGESIQPGTEAGLSRVTAGIGSAAVRLVTQG